MLFDEQAEFHRCELAIFGNSASVHAITSALMGQLGGTFQILSTIASPRFSPYPSIDASRTSRDCLFYYPRVVPSLSCRLCASAGLCPLMSHWPRVSVTVRLSLSVSVMIVTGLPACVRSRFLALVDAWVLQTAPWAVTQIKELLLWPVSQPIVEL